MKTATTITTTLLALALGATTAAPAIAQGKQGEPTPLPPTTQTAVGNQTKSAHSVSLRRAPAAGMLKQTKRADSIELRRAAPPAPKPEPKPEAPTTPTPAPEPTPGPKLEPKPGNPAGAEVTRNNLLAAINAQRIAEGNHPLEFNAPQQEHAVKMTDGLNPDGTKLFYEQTLIRGAFANTNDVLRALEGAKSNPDHLLWWGRNLGLSIVDNGDGTKTIAVVVSVNQIQDDEKAPEYTGRDWLAKFFYADKLVGAGSETLTFQQHIDGFEKNEQDLTFNNNGPLSYDWKLHKGACSQEHIDDCTGEFIDGGHVAHDDSVDTQEVWINTDGMETGGYTILLHTSGMTDSQGRDIWTKAGLSFG